VLGLEECLQVIPHIGIVFDRVCGQRKRFGDSIERVAVQIYKAPAAVVLQKRAWEVPCPADEDFIGSIEREMADV
jgi:hypothetical protein